VVLNARIVLVFNGFVHDFLAFPRGAWMSGLSDRQELPARRHAF
jgi:hypothetical protein